MLVARTGYTGEDGFEFYVPQEQTAALWDALFARVHRGLKPIGLGARDTLRLEARMPLYGNELADDISPIEAGLGWAVKLDKGPFIGREAIAAVKESGPSRRTVGFRLLERAGSAQTRLSGGHWTVGRVGVVTSGAHSPTLGGEIGLALVEADVAGVGKPLEIIIRGRPCARNKSSCPSIGEPATDPATPVPRRQLRPMESPADRKYTKTHEWVALDGDIATIGVTDFAQSELGDITYLELPEVGDAIALDQAFGIIESVKAANDIFSPVDGDVVERNEEAVAAPELINGIAVRRRLAGACSRGQSAQLDALMSAEEYAGAREVLRALAVSSGFEQFVDGSHL